MIRSKRFLELAALFACASCAFDKAKDESCANTPTLEDRKKDALTAAANSYVEPVVAACPELDPPSDGALDSLGLTEQEFQGLLRGANGNFFDDGTWWIKAMPRGGVHQRPLKIVAEHCQEVTYDRFGYDYAFAVPPLTAAPDCGRYLTGILAGHKLGDSWPAVFGIEASGLMRLAPLSPSSVFDAYLQSPRGLLGTSTETSSVDRLDVELHDADSLEFAAVVSGVAFTSALRVVVKVGDETRLAVSMDIYPRANIQGSPRVAVAGLSGSYLANGAHDFDRVQVSYADGMTLETKLDDGSLEWKKEGWAHVPGTTGTAGVQSISLAQAVSQGSAPRSPKVTISNIDSSLPIAFDLAITNQAIAGGNVVGSLVLDLSEAAALESPIHVAYLATAAPP